MRGIVWFREDLRVCDNPALFHALEKCKDGIIAVYIIDTDLWQRHHMAACRIEFLLRGLQVLRTELNQLNIPLVIRQITTNKIISETLFKILDNYQAKYLFYNLQYEINESRRDQSIQKYLAQKNIECFSYHDQVILPPGSVRNQQGEDFKVFTPYKRAWNREYFRQTINLFPKPKPQIKLIINSDIVPTSLVDFTSNIAPDIWPAGELIAKKKLQYFINNNLTSYEKDRNFPALDNTSKLSPYLSTGMISARTCFMAALAANQGELDTGNKGALTWMSELIWRDFYKNILLSTPRISMGKPYKFITEKIPWKFNQQQYQAWCEGNTGFPIIDAAMRQLNTTGWMHNRLRMITAMFFTKNLFFDWRIGEQYFIEHLIDGDLAANNGGWQWCASTGTDAVPYFRIFNPITQSERFDPNGDFIQQYCPELKIFDKKTIHDPHGRAAEIAKKLSYPLPLVNLQTSRQFAIETFKQINLF